MLQAYSTSLSVAANAAFPFNNLVVDKGCAEKLTAPASIELNKRGVYLVEVDGFATGSAAGTDTIQLYKDGIALPQAQSSISVTASSVSNFGFKTLIQVSENNCICNCCSSPTVLQIINGEAELVDTHINVVVSKLC